ncbi:hypothetical protein PPERSA_02100 [Pseudocohnilembus persalinus]|uniref:Transmembrane protein n=1 Tax=Pseudocohnilembus persalinus TaxID=266149 RepID=A0A0V0Q7U4_PSEPJ|nr:hypothetical protein PPERSA_02100 [Pseudocohnilembus persalinus]|eukprot:KRW98323.1 hypothetical protein PPERSA_02100 [Pseudocohnilembus persalinus]
MAKKYVKRISLQAIKEQQNQRKQSLSYVRSYIINLSCKSLSQIQRSPQIDKKKLKQFSPQSQQHIIAQKYVKRLNYQEQQQQDNNDFIDQQLQENTQQKQQEQDKLNEQNNEFQKKYNRSIKQESGDQRATEDNYPFNNFINLLNISPQAESCYQQNCMEQIEELGSAQDDEYDDIGYEVYLYEQCVKQSCDDYDFQSIYYQKQSQNGINSLDQINNYQNSQTRGTSNYNDENTYDGYLQGLQQCHYQCGIVLKQQKVQEAHYCALQCLGVNEVEKRKRENTISLAMYILTIGFGLFIFLSCFCKLIEAKQSQDRYNKQILSYKQKMKEIQAQQMEELSKAQHQFKYNNQVSQDIEKSPANI